MDTIPINKIVRKDNIRVDLGDVDALAASIKAEGIKQPVIITDKHILIDGYRRVAAAEKAGLKEVPCVIRKGKFSEMDLTMDQVIHGTHNKSITPTEEADAFQTLKKKHGMAVEHLAISVGRTPQYVERRLKLNKCTQETLDALETGKLQVGHAELLSQMDEKQQKVALKAILEFRLTVKEFAETMRWNSKLDLSEFKLSKIKGQNTLLESLGTELGEDYDAREKTSEITSTPAFRKEVAEYVESQRDLLRKKGMLVYTDEAKLKKDYPGAKKVDSWESKYTTVVKKLPGGKDAAVVVELAGGSGELLKNVYLLKPSQEKKKNAKTTPEDYKEADDMLQVKKGEQLKGHIKRWKTDKLQNYFSKMELSPAVMDAVLLLAMGEMGMSQTAEKLREESKRNPLFHTLHLTKVQTEKWKEQFIREYLETMSLEEAEILLDYHGMGMSEFFELTEDYLAPYTKDDLMELAKEFKINGMKKTNRDEMVRLLLEGWTKGQIPNILQED